MTQGQESFPNPDLPGNSSEETEDSSSREDDSAVLLLPPVVAPGAPPKAKTPRGSPLKIVSAPALPTLPLSKKVNTAAPRSRPRSSSDSNANVCGAGGALAIVCSDQVTSVIEACDSCLQRVLTTASRQQSHPATKDAISISPVASKADSESQKENLPSSKLATNSATHQQGLHRLQQTREGPNPFRATSVPATDSLTGSSAQAVRSILNVTSLTHSSPSRPQSVAEENNQHLHSHDVVRSSALRSAKSATGKKGPQPQPLRRVVNPYRLATPPAIAASTSGGAPHEEQQEPSYVESPQDSLRLLPSPAFPRSEPKRPTAVLDSDDEEQQEQEQGDMRDYRHRTSPQSGRSRNNLSHPHRARPPTTPTTALRNTVRGRPSEPSDDSFTRLTGAQTRENFLRSSGAQALHSPFSALTGQREFAEPGQDWPGQ